MKLQQREIGFPLGLTACITFTDCFAIWVEQMKNDLHYNKLYEMNKTETRSWRCGRNSCPKWFCIRSIYALLLKGIWIILNLPNRIYLNHDTSLHDFFYETCKYALITGYILFYRKHLFQEESIRLNNWDWVVLRRKLSCDEITRN